MQHQVVYVRESNSLGVAGFVVSLIGFLSCGLLSPIGALLSFFGLFTEPRGLAIAGFLIGVAGSIWLGVFGLATVIAFLAFVGILGAAAESVGEVMETTAPLQAAAAQVREFQDEYERLPLESEAEELIDATDPWGEPIHYRAYSDSNFAVISKGPDKLLDTADDTYLDISAEGRDTERGPAPQIKEPIAPDPTPDNDSPEASDDDSL